MREEDCAGFRVPHRSGRAASLTIGFLAAFSGACFAQRAPAPCGPPAAIFQTTQPNIFSEQQEQWLGDAMADQIEREYRPVRNPAENAYLQQIGERLLAVLPKSSIQFRFILVDSPEVNGFSLAGGRVYLTRKLVANAHSEDEVAGVVAHEIGHILTHQFAVETTADLQRLLGVTSVGDRADIYAKFQRLVDARMRDKKKSSAGDTDEKQDEADRVSVYAVAAAGYRPQGYAEFWDRSFFVGGKTGGRFSDFFSLTKPNEKRLRELRRLVAALPAGCGASETPKNVAFDHWRDEVIANQPGAEVAVPRSVSEVKLTPALPIGLDRLRFSQDGRRILAQDESSVYVISRDPFKLLFRFDADSALPASFTKDGEQINFHTPSLHVERWSVAEQKLLEAHEMVLQNDCLQSILSPDGRTVLCMRWGSPETLDGSAMSLQLLDVATNQAVAEKRNWFQPSFLFELLMATGMQLDDKGLSIPASFSSDGDTVLLGPAEARLAFDLRTRTPIKLGSGVQHGFDGLYQLLGNDRLVGINTSHPKETGMMSFPEGKELKKFPVSFTELHAATKGNYGIIPMKDGGSGLIDFDAERLAITIRWPAMDAWDKTVVFENGNGSLGLVRKLGATESKDIETLKLPPSRLGPASAVAISSGGRYLAYSGRTRGGVWDVQTGEEVTLVRGYLRAWWVNDNVLLAELPKWDKEPPRIVQLTVSTKTVTKMPYTLEKDAHLESGHLMEWKGMGRDKWQLIVHDPMTDAVAWTKNYSGGRPAYTNNQLDDDLIFSYALGSSLAKEKLRADGTLEGEARAVKVKDAGRLIEVLDPMTGAVRRQVVVERPKTYAGVDGYTRVGDLLYLSVGDNRTIVYSLTTGQELRQIFGTVVAAEAKSENIATMNRRGEATVYDKAGTQLDHLELGSIVRFAAFGEGGKELIVLTADQRIRRFEVGAGSKSGTAVTVADNR